LKNTRRSSFEVRKSIELLRREIGLETIGKPVTKEERPRTNEGQRNQYLIPPPVKRKLQPCFYEIKGIG